MAGQTLNRSYPYPTGTDANDVPFRMQALAEALDVDVDTIADALAVFTAANVGARANISLTRASGGAAPDPVNLTTDKISPGSGFANNGTTISVPAGQYTVAVMGVLTTGNPAAGSRVFIDLAVNGASVPGGRFAFGTEDNASGSFQVILTAPGTIGLKFYQINGAASSMTLSGNVTMLKRPAPLGF